MGTVHRPSWALICLVAAAATAHGIELKQAPAPFTSSTGAEGWLPMVRPASLSSAAASMVAAAAAAAAVSADPSDDSTDGRQRALQHPVMSRIQQLLGATPKRLLRPNFDGFLGGSNKVEVFAPPPSSLLTTFGQVGIRKPSPMMSAQESRFAAFEQSAPSIFFVQPPPAPSNPSVFTLPPQQHHGSFPLFPAQQTPFFRTQPQHEFRFIPDQSSFSGLTHSFIPPVDRSKQQANRYLPSVSQSFEIHPSRQPLVRPLVPSPQYSEEARPSLAPITFPPQRSSPAPFKPFPEQRLPFLPNDSHQQVQQTQFQQPFQHQQFQQFQQHPIHQQIQQPQIHQQQIQQPQIQQPQIQQPQIQQPQIQQPQIQQPPVSQQHDAALIDQNQSHLQQRPIEKLRITRPYFEETRPTVSNANYGPQTFPTPHAFVDFPPTSFFFPQPTQTEPQTTTTTSTTTTEAPEILSSPPHVNEVQPVEQVPDTPAPPKRKIPHHRRRKPNRATTTTTPIPDVSRDDDFNDNIPPSVLPESAQYQQEVPLPQSDPTFETVSTYQPPSVEPTQFQNEPTQFQNEPSQFQNEPTQFQNEPAEQNQFPNHFHEEKLPAVEPSPTLPQLPEPSFVNHESQAMRERISNVPSTEATINEETPATFRPRRKKPTAIRHRIQEEVTTTPAPQEIPNHQPKEISDHQQQEIPNHQPQEIRNHRPPQDVPTTTVAPQPEPSTETPAPSSTVATISSRLRPRIRFNTTRPSFSLKEYRGRINKPTPPSEPETSSPATAPSAIPPRVRYPSRVRNPYRPSTTDEPSTTGNEPTRTKSRFSPRFRTSTTTSAPDTVSSPTETSETKTHHFKANMARFRPGTGKYVSRFRMTSTTEAAITERTSRLPTRTTGVYSVRRPAPTEAPEVAPVPFTPQPPTEDKPPQAEAEDLETHPSNQPFSEFTPESRSTTSSETPVEPSPEMPAETSENYPQMPIFNVQSPPKIFHDIPDMTAEAISVPPPDIHIDAETPPEEVHQVEQEPLQQSEAQAPLSTPPPKPTGTAQEQDNEVLPAPSEPEEQQTDVSPDDMMLSPSSRIADLTSSPNNKYDNPQLRLKSAIPPRISLSTDDPILPIEAFFNSWNKKSS